MNFKVCYINDFGYESTAFFFFFLDAWNFSNTKQFSIVLKN